MALMAPVDENGKIVETDSQNSLKDKTKSNSGMDKDAFLQLLVAQMKYQDPLEPTSNTEFVSQYAQFSQVEQMQNMSSTMDFARASSLVGKEVYVKTTTASGEIKLIKGKVDSVVYEGNKSYVSINESLYSLEDVYSVVDKEYEDAYEKAYSFTLRLNKLPSLSRITDLEYADEIDELQKIYENMNEYERSFVTEENEKKLKEYVDRIQQIRDRIGQSGAPESPEEPGSPEEPEAPEGDEAPEAPESPEGDEAEG